MVSGARSGSMQLLCALAILLVLGAVLLIGGTSPHRTRASGPEGESGLDPQQLATISVAATPRVARRVERIRGLEFERVPEPEVVSSGYLNRLAARETRRAGDEAKIAADEAVLRITGLLASGEELEPALSSSGDLAAAAYDTRSERLYVVEDAVVANRALIEFFLAHELDHALEDQRFGLGGGGRRNDDAALAQLALSEGTATALMLQYGGEHLNSLELLAASAGLSSDTGEMPKAVLDQLTWAYLGGSTFVEELRRLGGGWTLVDYALESRAPASTEQVLHPEKFVRDERPEAVEVRSAELRRRGWKRAGGGTIGELASVHLLRLGGDSNLARRAAAGWDGDRYELWRQDLSPADCAHPCREDFVLVAVWRWDSALDADEFADAVPSYVEALHGDSLADGVGTVDGGAVAFRAGSAATALVFAPDEATATAVAVAQPLGG